jgi:hypothetical protein
MRSKRPSPRSAAEAGRTPIQIGSAERCQAAGTHPRAWPWVGGVYRAGTQPYVAAPIGDDYGGYR